MFNEANEVKDIENRALRHAVSGLYKCVTYFLSTAGFRGARINILLFTFVIKVRPSLCQYLGAFEKRRKSTISFFISLCPHGITRLQTYGFFFLSYDISVFFEIRSIKLKFH